MRLRDDIVEIIAAHHVALIARRAEAKAKIAELVKEIEALALLLDGLQEHCRSSTYPLVLGEALGMKPAAAADAARKVKTMAKRPVDKSFFVVNGLLQAPARKTPKAAKPSSAIMKVASLHETIRTACERGLNPQEAEVIRGMVDRLRKELG